MSGRPAPVAFHWIMTVHTADGRQGTNDGPIEAVPGLHTDTSTYTTVLNTMKQWIGTDDVTVVFYRLVPDTITTPQ